MTAGLPTAAMRRFVDYFGELGPRWGLPAEACRVHAYLYLIARPSPEGDIADALALEHASVAEALAFLVDYQLVDRVAPASWQTSGDPWDMLLRGLEQRRRRELPPALATMRACQDEAMADGTTEPAVARQIGRMMTLMEQLAALESRAQHLSPRLFRGVLGASGRAARFVDRAFGSRRVERP